MIPTILHEPLGREQLERLRDTSRDGRVQAVVGLRWWVLLELDGDRLGEVLAAQVTGCRTGLGDIAVGLLGCVGDTLVFEVGGDPGEFLANYDQLMEREAADRRGDLIYGVNVPLVARRAHEQLVAAGLDRRPRDRGMLRQRRDRGGLGLVDDGTRFADGTPVEDLHPDERGVVLDMVWGLVEEYLGREDRHA
jgi:hypothetical protein